MLASVRPAEAEWLKGTLCRMVARAGIAIALLIETVLSTDTFFV